MALGLGAFAILSANLSALIPGSVVTGLHATRLEGGNLNILRNEVAQLRGEAARLRTENGKIDTIMSLAEQDRGDVVRRLGALEQTIPNFDEITPIGEIDTQSVTGGISESEKMSDTDGGMVSVTRTPMVTSGTETENLPDVDQPLPEALVEENTMPTLPVIRVTSDAFGIALGPEVNSETALATWHSLRNRAGSLLLGLQPILGGEESSGKTHVVVGPLDSSAAASDICARLSRIGIGCLPVGYSGVAMQQ